MTAPGHAGPHHDAPIDTIDTSRRLIRIGDKGMSLAERIANHFHRLTWRTPLHAMYLRGLHPLKLLAVPDDPIPGNPDQGAALLSGTLRWMDETTELATLDFAGRGLSAPFVDHIQSFGWLRDLSAAVSRAEAAPIAEQLVRGWLLTHGDQVDEVGWRPDLWGLRILNWAAHAPLILSSTDLIYRSAVLNSLARGARHLDRGADKAPQGLPRVHAWAGAIASGLLFPGGDARIARAEQGLIRALDRATFADGGIVSRSPVELVALIETLAQLRAVYEARRRTLPDPAAAALTKAVPALLGVTLGDARLSSWQGAGPLGSRRLALAVEAAGVRVRPLRQSREWGYQRLSGGQTVAVVDCAPPPASRLTKGGCASTLAFELADGPHRLIVNCGGGKPGGRLAPAIAEALRTTAAHSTLVVADSNSTAVHPDGSLGRGVGEVDLERQELELASRIEATHDGYVRRYGLLHRRQLALTSDGRELRGEDILLPAGERRRATALGFTIRFHLGPRVEATATVDGLGALLSIEGGALWHFRCRGGTLTIEDSVWIDGRGRTNPSQQLVISGEAPAGGTSVAWLLRRAG